MNMWRQWFFLSQKPDETTEIDLNLEELDAAVIDSKATYGENKAYVWEKRYVKVFRLYLLSQAEVWIEGGENYNLSKF